MGQRRGGNEYNRDMGQLNTGTLDQISQGELPPGILKEDIDVGRRRRPTTSLQQNQLDTKDVGRFRRITIQFHPGENLWFYLFYHTRLYA